MVSPQGEILQTHSLTFVPETIGVRARDGAIFVGGQGQLARLSAEGELQQKMAFPPPPSEEEQQQMLEQMLKQVEQQMQQMQIIAGGIENQLKAAQEKLAAAPLSEEEQKKIAAMSQEELFGTVRDVTITNNELCMTFKDDTPLGIQARVYETYLEQLGAAADVEKQREQMERQIREQVKQRSGSSSFTGLAVADDDLYVVCMGAGYSFNAWRMTHDLAEPKMIVGGLSGCCGQLDCQTQGGNLWLAMNTQHQVVCYDRDGTELSRFGKNDSEAPDGFGGCCEPKNLRFSADGKYVYCAQSGPPVCVKRFTLSGEFQDVVCFPVYETGCVRVSVDTADGKFYLMSPNESTIYVFQANKS